MKTEISLKKICSLFFIFGLIGFAGASVAYGAQAYSNIKNLGTVNGYTYQNSAYIDNSNKYAGSEISTTNGGNAPVGYMGADAHLYAAGGTLCEDSGWKYNGMVWPNQATQTTFGDYCGTGNYYSSGFTRAYNGNGYDTKNTDQSPQLAFP